MTEPTRSQVDPSGEFRLDVELAELAITQLEGVRLEIEAAKQRAVELARTPPTAHDPISRDSFALLAQKADGGPGSFASAMDAGIAHVDGLIREMRADIARQRELDAANAADLTGRA